MQPAPITKYRPFPPVSLPNRQWPSRTITRPPIWCSVDLRDGNQALAIPMGVEEKLEFFDLLVRIGFKEIEVGFPSASQIEFDFVRRLIEENRIPDDVAIQVLCQCREDLITRTVESIAGAQNVIFHLYNSTSPAQRRYVFGAEKPAIVKIATDAVGLMKRLTRPLVAAGTSPAPGIFARELHQHRTRVRAGDLRGRHRRLAAHRRQQDHPQPAGHRRVRHAQRPRRPDRVDVHPPHAGATLTLVSLHTHNDRGTGVAATELGLLAGADRVEGTLFGNGERTGNLDIVTVALNLYTHGIHPGLDFTDINAIRDVYERCTRMEVPARQPYAGELVFTAFSGSHQDAIKKSWAAQKPGQPWDVLYIPIDPADIGRSLQGHHPHQQPVGQGRRGLRDGEGVRLRPAQGHAQGVRPRHQRPRRRAEDRDHAAGDPRGLPPGIHRPRAAGEAGAFPHHRARQPGEMRGLHQVRRPDAQAHRHGQRPDRRLCHALGAAGLPPFELLSYSEHSLGKGAEARAVSYIQIKTPRGLTYFGAGIDTNIELASIKALVSALNRSLVKR